VREGLKHASYLKVDRAEAELVTGLSDFQGTARHLAEYGPPKNVVTQSAGVTVYADRRKGVRVLGRFRKTYRR
jgi:sugar/nucleoside kinase (ribokinase family)